jgi:ferredoxin-NADP reductase
MARAAIPGRLSLRRTWRPAALVDRWPETPSASTLVLDVGDWPGHIAGQHIDVRLTAEDGYQASRSYSLAAPADGERIQVTVQRLVGGEVSPFLVDELDTGAVVEVRGPFGGWFVWRAEDRGPVLLLAGGSGIVPLMAMIRARAVVVSREPFRLVCSVRTPDDRLYAAELRRRVADEGGLDVAWVHTRTAPVDDLRPAGRLRPDDLERHGWPPDFEPTCYVCGPTGFVEAAANLLLAAGHDPRRIRTERFGGA